MEILHTILQLQAEKIKLIKSFQDQIWSGDEFSSDSRINEILEELAYDLDYYQPLESLRKEDASYYGEERLEKEIKDALLKMQKIADTN